VISVVPGNLTVRASAMVQPVNLHTISTPSPHALHPFARDEPRVEADPPEPFCARESGLFSTRVEVTLGVKPDVRRLPGTGQKCSQEIRGMFGVVVLENQGERTRELP
jgi:hypothetical protein